MKKTLIVGSIMTVLTLVGASAAYAEDTTVTGSATVNNDGATVQVKMATNSAIKDQIQVMRAEIRTAASTTRADIKAIRPEMSEATGTAKMDLKTEIEVRKEDLANRRASTTVAIKAMMATRITNTMKMAQVHLGQEMNRLSEISSKIDTRLSKFDAQGASTVAARADFALAITSMADAQAKINAVGTIQVTTDTQTSAETLRKAVLDAQGAINTAQSALLKIVSDMKGLEATVHATSSAEVQ